ncbi:hypothetical protein BJX68DRAFT_39576 [Aspergillus pseudodeflectus]|uniref:Secreted protein n=1 Tax=Aspergillus pseudodeflectus TaxID=176178 RepID=A0ABR4KQN8_9EURO
MISSKLSFSALLISTRHRAGVYLLFLFSTQAWTMTTLPTRNTSRYRTVYATFLPWVGPRPLSVVPISYLMYLSFFFLANRISQHLFWCTRHKTMCVTHISRIICFPYISLLTWFFFSHCPLLARQCPIPRCTE